MPELNIISLETCPTVRRYKIMVESFSIYKSPLSSETQVLRRNALLATSLCLFIGLTKELPKSFALFGVSFNASQQSNVGWFLFAVALYFFLHFFAHAAVEVALWIRPFLEWMFTKKELLKHPAYDESDFIDIPDPADDYDLESVRNEAVAIACMKAEKQLRSLNWFIYLKLILEIMLPIFIGFWGLISLVMFIINGGTGTANP